MWMSLTKYGEERGIDYNVLLHLISKYNKGKDINSRFVKLPAGSSGHTYTTTQKIGGVSKRVSREYQNFIVDSEEMDNLFTSLSGDRRSVLGKVDVKQTKSKTSTKK